MVGIAYATQVVVGALHAQWTVELSKEWNVLGPFPIHAREQHYLSPSFPLNVSKTIDFSQCWPSSYGDGGQVSWTNTQANDNGDLRVSFPDVRWQALRATEGWAALQFHSVLQTSLTIHPPHVDTNPADDEIPQLLVHLIQGSFFTIIPSAEQPTTPEWHAGNIYNLKGALPRPVSLPTSPSITSPTKYHLFISGDYEIRLFGDPRSYNTEIPILSIKVSVEVEMNENNIVREPTQDIVADFVDGWAFGNAIGVGIRSVSGWWNVTDVALTPSVDGLSLTLLRTSRVAPSQARTIPFRLDQTKPFHGTDIKIDITAVSFTSTVVIHAHLAIAHHTLWTRSHFVPIQASYFYAQSNPTAFLVLPPEEENLGAPSAPILALHGAGVEILDDEFWSGSLSRQKSRWVVMPTGRTSWGLDWHGPSAADAWASLDELVSIIDRNALWHPWKLENKSSAIVFGHSNGGQGAWYFASRFPDRVSALVPAAGYIKSQAYVPLTMSRAGHFIDPSLRAILESSLTPDDNDLFLSNLADTPILAIHGGDDNNVPTWHSREAVGVIRTWRPDANITFIEDTGQPHWYPTILNSEAVQAFIDAVATLRKGAKTRPLKLFTLTVAIPAESGSLHGWRIESLTVPGRLGRLHVKDEGDIVRVNANNVYSFTIGSQWGEMSTLVVNGVQVPITKHATGLIRIQANRATSWVSTSNNDHAIQPSGRSQHILNSRGPFHIVIPDSQQSHELSVALRIAHDLSAYHRLDAEIVTSSQAVQLMQDNELGPGNVIVVGGAETPFTKSVLSQNKTSFGVQAGHLTLRDQPVVDADQGIIFLHPHPTYQKGTMMFLFGINISGLEKAVRLFPIRTGVAVPDWLVVTTDSDQMSAGGTVGAGVWGREWRWNEPMSWIY